MRGTAFMGAANKRYWLFGGAVLAALLVCCFVFHGGSEIEGCAPGAVPIRSERVRGDRDDESSSGRVSEFIAGVPFEASGEAHTLRVMDAVSGDPIPGAMASFSTEPQCDRSIARESARHGDSNGDLTFRDLEAPFLIVWAPDYSAQTLDVSGEQFPAAVRLVRSGLVILDIVHHGTMQPVSGLAVTLSTHRNDNMERRASSKVKARQSSMMPQLSYRGVSDGNGETRFRGVRSSDQLVVVIDTPDYLYRYKDPVEVKPGDAVRITVAVIPVYMCGVRVRGLLPGGGPGVSSLVVKPPRGLISNRRGSAWSQVGPSLNRLAAAASEIADGDYILWTHMWSDRSKDIGELESQGLYVSDAEVRIGALTRSIKIDRIRLVPPSRMTRDDLAILDLREAIAKEGLVPITIRFRAAERSDLLEFVPPSRIASESLALWHSHRPCRQPKGGVRILAPLDEMLQITRDPTGQWIPFPFVFNEMEAVVRPEAAIDVVLDIPATVVSFEAEILHGAIAERVDSFTLLSHEGLEGLTSIQKPIGTSTGSISLLCPSGLVNCSLVAWTIAKTFSADIDLKLKPGELTTYRARLRNKPR